MESPLKIVVDRNLPLVEEAFGPLGDLRLIATADFTPEAVRDADILVVRSETKIGPALLEGSNVRFVGTASAGLDHLDVGYLTRRGIAFTGAPGCNSNAVKEYVVAAFLEAAARLGTTLRGKTLGIVGTGRIGSRVAQTAESLGLRVLRNDPPLARATGDPALRPLDELMGADILTLHVPLTKDGPDPTFHLFGRGRLDSLKPGAILLNSSRGAVVESGALSAALRTGRLRGAVIDVWENEPGLDFDLLERVTIGTAHVAGYSIEGKLDAVRIVRDEIRAHFWVGCPWEPAEDPAPSAPQEIEAPPADLPDQEALRRIVRSAYDIGLDDTLLRGLSRLPAGERAEAFRRLRSGYRVRREFPGWTVRISPDREGLKGMVGALGFQTATSGGTDERRTLSALKERI